MFLKTLNFCNTPRSLWLPAAALAMALATGCGSSSSSSTSAQAGLPAAPAAGTLNSYVGTSPQDSTSAGNSGLWSAIFNRDASTCNQNGKACFTAIDVADRQNDSDPEVQDVTGYFTSLAAGSGLGFLSLAETNDPNNPNSPSAGFALEIPDRIALLRQGDNTVPPIAMVPAGCPTIGTGTIFNFVIMPTDIWNSQTDAAFGSVALGATSTTWKFGAYKVSTLDGTAAPNDGASLPVSTCALTVAGKATYVPTDPSMRLPQTIAVGPSGFYVADQGAYNGSGSPGQIGIIQPSAPLNTSDILAKNYVGYVYEPGASNTSGVLETQLAGFSANDPAGTLIGGGIPYDDPTQGNLGNLVIDLGKQGANGVYPSATITDGDTGNAYRASAVAGEIEGKYAIFIVGEDIDNFLPDGNFMPMGIYLLEQ